MNKFIFWLCSTLVLSVILGDFLIIKSNEAEAAPKPSRAVSNSRHGVVGGSQRSFNYGAPIGSSRAYSSHHQRGIGQGTGISTAPVVVQNTPNVEIPIDSDPSNGKCVWEDQEGDNCE